MQLNGEILRRMLKGGASGIRRETDRINNLNVFPVPDGDTGTNMTRTVESGLRSISDNDEKVGEIFRDFSKGALFGARGNSGVILSQYIAGICDTLGDKITVSAMDIVNASRVGVERAYSAIAKPVEGTMLTVFRESADYVRENVSEESTIEDLMKLSLAEAKRSLARTKELLPQLREADVVDSGGAGFVSIILGMYQALCGERVDSEEHLSADKPTLSYDLFTTDSVLEWGYCTECLVRLQRAKGDPESFDKSAFIATLEGLGADSIVLLRDGDILKLHAHTRTPSDILTAAQRFGEFLEVKIENMSLGHSESIKKQGGVKKKYALVAVANGEGLEALFKTLGVSAVINGGQTSNPSAEDFIKAFGEVSAENIIVLPNNGNVLLAAKQAAELYTDAAVSVVPTKTIAEGYSAISVFNPSTEDPESITADMQAAAEAVETVSVAKAIRDVKIGEVDVKEGEYIGILGGELSCSLQTAEDAALAALGEIEDLDMRELLTVFVGEGVDEERRVSFTERLEDSFPDLTVEVYVGGQSVYEYIIAAE